MSLHMTRFLGRHTLPAEHNRLVQGMLMGAAPGGSDCLSLSALSASVTQSVYRYLLHLTLNLVTSPVFLIFTDRASFLRAVSKKSLISLICFGCTTPQVELHQHFQLPAHRSSGYFVALCSSPVKCKAHCAASSHKQTIQPTAQGSRLCPAAFPTTAPSFCLG